MKKIHLVVLILAIIALIEGIYYLQIEGNSLTSVLQKISNTDNTSTIQDHSIDYQIVAQAEQDDVGRTVIYTQAAQNAFNGTGKISGDTNILTAYVGKFARFETITNSEDEYLLVENPETGELLVKGRIDYSSEYDQTDFRVEDLAETNTNISKVESLGLSSELGKETIKALIIERDIITVMLKPQDDNFSESKLDLDGNPLLERVILRRFGGKQQIQKEL